MQSKKKNEQTGLTALYCRLSRDDGGDGDSNSIVNQRKMLTKYAKENGFSNTRFYVDDGITGTRFDRPGFQAMLDDTRMSRSIVLLLTPNSDAKFSMRSVLRSLIASSTCCLRSIALCMFSPPSVLRCLYFQR